MPLAARNSAFSPFAEYSQMRAANSASTTFDATRPHPLGPAPVELIHSSDSIQALPPRRSSAFRPVKQMSSSAIHCSSLSSSSSSSLPGSSTTSTRSPQQPLRIPQPPNGSPHSRSPSSSTSTPNGSTRFSHHQPRQSVIPVKPQIIGAGSGNGALAAAAALHAARPEQVAKTYNELVDLARRQQQQIDANRLEIEDKSKLIATARIESGMVSTVSDQIRSLRADIARDERELAQLSSAQRQTRQLMGENASRRQELVSLQDTYSQDEQQLRHAVDKVDSLKKQLELLYRRRASAASAAIAQQRQMNAYANCPKPPPSLSTGPASTSTGSLSTASQNGQLGRPQASVGPFQVQRAALNSSSDSDKFTFDQLDHAPAAGTKLAGSRLPQRGPAMKRPDKPPPPPKRNPNTVSLYAGSDTVRLLNNGVDQPVPPTYSSLTNGFDYYQNLDQACIDNSARRGRADQLSIRNDSMKALKRRSWLQSSDAPEADIFRVLLEEQKKGRTHISFSDLHQERPPTASRPPQNTVNVNGVTVNLRNGVNVSPSRPKPIVEDAAVGTTPTAPALSAPAQLAVASVSVSVSPKTSPIKSSYETSSVNTDPSSTELEKPVAERRRSPERKEEEHKVTLEAVQVVDQEPEPSESDVVAEAELKKELEQLTIDELPQPESTCPETNVLDDIEPESPQVSSPELEREEAEAIVVADNDTNSSVESSADDEGSSSSEVPVVFDEPEEKTVIKGILRPPGKPKHKKRIVFDPFVLFLDGALEGQLDTVIENAAKIDNISRPNDEGITALHNAICACHYDIVKFLVDNGADVNALDSDGWSPLHCAASCNNLPMLKMLIENGASIYATTLSDAEMPIRKCEEKEAGFEQCIQYLEMCDRWTGFVNNGYVYAAYEYENPENEDELAFSEGDVLRVISRECEEDSLWWLCEHTTTGKRGLVPANFVGLYPTLKYAQRLGFKRFDIPSQAPNGSLNNNTSPHSSPKAEERMRPFDKNVEISANA